MQSSMPQLYKMTNAIPDSGKYNAASPVVRLLQMLFIEPQMLKASNELALTILHLRSPFTFPKTYKNLRRHLISEPSDAKPPIERLLEAVFHEQDSLTASNELADSLLLNLSVSPYLTFRGTSKYSKYSPRDSDHNSSVTRQGLWNPDQAYYLHQLDNWELSRYHKTRETLPNHEWPRVAEQLYQSLVEECFKVFKSSADAEYWLRDGLPMVLWCIETPTAENFFKEYIHKSNNHRRMIFFVAKVVPEPYNRLIRHLDNSDQKAGESLPPGYRKFLQRNESTYLRLAAYCRRIERNHEAQCFMLHEAKDGV